MTLLTEKRRFLSVLTPEIWRNSSNDGVYSVVDTFQGKNCKV